MPLKRKRVPIGTEFFDELIKNDCYYIDKTGLIAELLETMAKVTLFTRPRRFGKSLAMSTVKCFFGDEADPSLFDGLAISKEHELCQRHMGKYQVIMLSFKDVGGVDFHSAARLAAARISVEASHFEILRTSPNLTKEDKELFIRLLQRDMSIEVLSSSLWDLCRLIEKHFGQKVILLIDEYDVPLQKAFYGGYYEEMVDLMRSMFSQALKSNDSLAFAVLTGCLRISKESIFTGMNNLSVMTVADEKFSEYFGFTDSEVEQLLEYYGLFDRYGTVKEWYDGYRFGKTEVYCPWDVVNYVSSLLTNPKAWPQNFWANSSGNDAVGEFLRRTDTGSARRELENLMDGGAICKEIHPELTYRDMYSSVQNLWSLLYMTGYLTGSLVQKETSDMPIYELSIPNEEIRSIFTRQIMELFREETKNDGKSLRNLCDALIQGNSIGVQDAFNDYLKKVIGIRDTLSRNGRKENFYHGILLGILSYKEDWIVTSNHETGDGYGDIMAETDDKSLGFVIEVKYANDGNLEKSAQMALNQIEIRHYDQQLINDGIEKVLKYGIACSKKRCKVAFAKE